MLHDVSVRETEMYYTDLLISATEELLEATRTYLNFELSLKKLQSVVLPSYRRDVGSFYGLNNYQLSLNFKKRVAIKK